MSALSTAHLREMVKLAMPVRMTSESLAEIADRLDALEAEVVAAYHEGYMQSELDEIDRLRDTVLHACDTPDCPAITYRCAETPAMSGDARERALAALEVIDTADFLLGTHSHGEIVNARKDRAFVALAAAMDEIYGPLTDDTVITVDAWRDE